MDLFNKVKDTFIDWLMKDAPPKEIPPCDFGRIQHELRQGDVILIEGRNRIGEVIKRIIQSPWSHAALYIGRIHDIEDPALRKIAASHLSEYEGNPHLIIEGFLGKGTVVSPLSDYKYDHIRICRPKGISYEDAQKVIAFAIKSIGKPYDVRQILDLLRFLLPWAILPRRWGSSLFKTRVGEREREICSSLIADAFESVQFPILPLVQAHAEKGFELIPRNTRLFTPKDFDYSPFFEIIKYPMVSVEFGSYRHLPWTDKNIISNDEEVILPPQLKNDE